MNDYDRLSGIVIFIVGVTILGAVLLNYPIGSPGNPAGGFFPLIISFLIISLSSVLIIQSFLGKREKATANPPFFPEKESPKRVLLGFICLVGFRFLLPILGFRIATFLFSFSLTYFLGYYSWKVCILFSVLVAFSAYLVFEVWLLVLMPRGILGM